MSKMTKIALVLFCVRFLFSGEQIDRESHSIEISGIESDRITSTSVKSEQYDFRAKRFGLMSRTNGVESGGFLLKGPCPSGLIEVTCKQGDRELSGSYVIPKETKNIRGIDKVVFLVVDGKLVGKHSYSGLKDMRGSFDWMGTREWQFSEDGAVTQVEVRELTKRKEKVTNRYKVFDGSPKLEFISVVTENLVTWFTLNEKALVKEVKVRRGESYQAFIEYFYDGSNKLLHVYAFNKASNNIDLDVTDKTLDAPKAPDVSVYVIPIMDWDAELKRAGLSW